MARVEGAFADAYAQGKRNLSAFQAQSNAYSDILVLQVVILFMYIFYSALIEKGLKMLSVSSRICKWRVNH